MEVDYLSSVFSQKQIGSKVAFRVGTGAHHICLSFPWHPLLPLHSPHGVGSHWTWKGDFLPATASEDSHPHWGGISPDDPRTFIKGMFANILVLDSHSLSAGWHSQERNWEAGQLLGEARKWNQVRGPWTKSPLLSVTQKAPTSRLRTLEGHTGSLPLEVLIIHFQAQASHNNYTLSLGGSNSHLVQVLIHSLIQQMPVVYVPALKGLTD